MTPAEVADRMQELCERIAAAAARAGRAPQEIRLIGAAKRQPAELVEAAIRAGLSDVGESYVQEAAAKRGAATSPARWHMIGHLQRNKAKKAVELFDVVQTVDKEALANALSRAAGGAGRRLSVLVEVNVGGEDSKSGTAPERVPDLVAVLRERSDLAVDGLMTIPPIAGPDTTRAYFRRLRELAERLDLRELSMGMSDDFEIAVEEGATMVRIGRALFGERGD